MVPSSGSSSPVITAATIMAGMVMFSSSLRPSGPPPAQVPQPVGRIARRNGEQDDQHLAKYVPKIHLSLSPLIIPEFGSYATRVQAERALAAAWRPMDVHRVPVRS